MLSTALHHPRKLWLRRALFQIHLWLGVLLSLYVIVIGLSGSILVFQDEIRRASLSSTSLDNSHVASVSTVVDLARKNFPASHLTFLTLPQHNAPYWTLYLTNSAGKADLVYADAASGVPLKQHRLLIDWVLDLHVYLLMGTTGFIINCLAGIGLLVLALTGTMLWWQGLKLWMRGLFIAFRRGWKRINYDTHNAVGIWTLLIVSWWGTTAVYFLFPKQVAAVVNIVSPLVGMKQPETPNIPQGTSAVSLESILVSSSYISHGSLSSLSIPAKPGDAVTVYVDRAAPGDFSHRDILTFDGHTGRLLTTWHYGENHSLGDWFLWLMHPLHFGTLWGTTVKIIWAILGMSLPLLSVTGLMMYWNRWLSKRWSAL